MHILSCLVLCCVGFLSPNAPALPGDSANIAPPLGAVGAWPGGDRDDGILEGGKTRSKALVVVLHGGSWKPKSPAELARSALDALSSEARKRKLRLLAPPAPAECRSSVPWIEPAGEALVMALIVSELQAGRAVADRVYLAGHGSGATAALVLAARHPEKFAAVAVWSGTPPPLWDENRQVVGLAHDPVPYLRGVPVYLWTGDDDPILDREALRLFVDGMQAEAQLDRAYVLHWDHGSGRHDYGAAGPRQGLKFLQARRKQRRP
jgi:pimeloyl-ACP methyl ester carboxylesterase